MRSLAIPALGTSLWLCGCVPDRVQTSAVTGVNADSAEIIIHQQGLPGSAVESLIVLRVAQVPCGSPGASESTVRWQIHAGDGVGTKPAPVSIRYGVPPKGYEVDVAPTPLGAGCYEILVQGDGLRGQGRFRVSRDGVIEAERTLSPPS